MVLNNIPVVHVNRHPILLDHDTRVVLEAKPGESLFAFLARNEVDTQGMQVSVDGRIIDAVEWHRVTMSDGKEIVLRSTVHKSALYLVAMVALLYFTGGAAAAVMSGGSFGGIVTAGAIAGMSTAASMAAIGAVQIVGAMLINKVLGPRVPTAQNIERGSAYNIAAARNAARQWEATGILFGSVRVTPDFAAQAFNYYQGNDQYMQMLLTPGINVARYDALYFGDTLLSSYNGVTVKKRGFSAMTDDVITATTNVDTIAGGELEANIPVIRTTPADVVRVQVDLQYHLFDLTSKGKKKYNQETVQVFMRKVGETTWQLKGSHFISNREQTEQRRSFFYDVENGAYDVRVNRLGQDTNGSGATCKFTLVSVVAYQASQNNFDGVSVIQIDMKGTGQLNGAPDEVRAVMYADSLPLWTGTEWITVTEPGANGTSNPGAQALQYARGFRSETGALVAGMGLDDDQINIDAFKALMVHCINNNIQYNMLVQDERNHKEFLDAILYPAMGRVSMAPGRLTPLWAREEQGSSGSVNMATIKKAEFQVNYTLVSAADGVEFTYIDRNTWETKTLRVPLPGGSVEDMRNPATISGEGILDEAQAATMARYHLGQTLYQAKDITYSTSLQFLAYQEMDLLDLQHDLTQWGYGGRLTGIRNVGGVITIDIDDDVPGRDLANAWVGLHLPDETNYRVFKVKPFAGTSSTLTLVGDWPNDADFPANVGTKAIHDTTWIYDFKQTPGKRVRVVGMTPDDDLNGASVSVVPEDAEFWTFVKTGNYVPPSNNSQLNVKPIAENLSISENVIIQGDTTFTELQANWTVSNNSVRNVVTCALSGEEPQVVGDTTGISASWRIYREGVYIVTVRPYAENGTPGVAVTTVYNTEGTDLPPVNVDSLSVVDIGSGIRKYSWAWLETTIQSPDTAGVEIRYVAGAVSSPFWDDMTPIGNDGFFTSAFESAVPVAGQWTFAIRARNTSGMLSANILVVTYTLASSITQIVEKVQGEITQEIIDRFNGDAAAILEAVRQASEYTNTQVAALNSILEDIVGADEWNATNTYPKGDFVRHDNNMYRALAENTNVEPGTDGGATWQLIGDYTSVGDALAAAISMSTTNASDIAVQAQRVDGVIARMPAGNGAVASQATVSALQQALIDEATTRAQQIDAVNASLAGKASAGAVTLLEGRVGNVEGEVVAQGQAITQVESEMAGIATAQTNLATRTTALESSAEITQAALASLGGSANLFENSDFVNGTNNAVTGWAFAWNPGAWGPVKRAPGLNNWEPSGGISIGCTHTGTPAVDGYGVVYQEGIQAVPGKRYIISGFTANHRCTTALAMRFMDRYGVNLAEPKTAYSTLDGNGGNSLSNWEYRWLSAVAPATAATVDAGVWVTGKAGAGAQPFFWFTRPMLELASDSQTQPSPWAPGGNSKQTASAVSTLSTNINATTGKVNAVNGVYLDVNGYVSGTVSENNGVRSSFTVSADVFRVVSPAGGARTEFSDGNWRVYADNGTMIIRMGKW